MSAGGAAGRSVWRGGRGASGANGSGSDLGLDCFRVGPWQAVQRQPKADRRIAGHQEQSAVAEVPFAALPDAHIVADGAAQRQYRADRRVEPTAEHARQPCAFHFVRQLRVLGHHVRRQPLLAPAIVVGILMGRVDQRGIDLQPLRQGGAELRGIGRSGGVAILLRGEQFLGAPDRFTVRAPVCIQRPARQLLARIVLAGDVLQRRRRRPQRAQPAHQPRGEALLGGAERVGVPLRFIEIGGGDEGRLAAHRQPHVAGGERAIHRRTHRQDVLPLRLRVGLGDTWGLAHPRHMHLEAEFGFAFLHRPGDRRGGLRIWRGGERNMALASQQAGCGIQAYPAGARQIGLGPRVQVGKVRGRTLRPGQRLHVADELDQITGDEARRIAELAQRLHQQPGGIAARALTGGQRFLGCPDAGLHAHNVGDAALHRAIEGDEHVHGALLAARHGIEQRL